MAQKQESPLPSTAKRNIDTIAEVEHALLRKRTFAERLGQRMAHFFGSLLFIAAHIFFFTFWIMVNTGGIQRVPRFDPYPFAFLGLIVGIESILLTTFVLLNQKYQIRREEQWAHLHLQLSMLTEQEVTQICQCQSARQLHRLQIRRFSSLGSSEKRGMFSYRNCKTGRRIGQEPYAARHPFPSTVSLTEIRQIQTSLCRKLKLPIGKVQPNFGRKTMEEDNENIDQLLEESLIQEHRRRRDVFADEAHERGLVFDPDTGFYADEKGNALNEYGERV